MRPGLLSALAHFDDRKHRLRSRSVLHGDLEAWQDRGQLMVGGYIKNAAGFPARRVQLLVEALDASGRVTGQRLGWLGSDLTPGMRA